MSRLRSAQRWNNEHPQEGPAIHGNIITTKATAIPIRADWVNAVIKTELTMATE
jgi:hypothetical protein